MLLTLAAVTLALAPAPATTPALAVPQPVSIVVADTGAADKWTNWYYVAGDKALQFRYGFSQPGRALPNGGTEYDLQFQFRIDPNSKLGCTYASCGGYYLYAGFGWDNQANRRATEYSLFFPKEFTGVYSLPATVPVRVNVNYLRDGSQVVRMRDDGFIVVRTADGSYEEPYAFWTSCVDDKNNDTPNKLRCGLGSTGGFDLSKVVTVSGS
jgi:hypothetical protein